MITDSSGQSAGLGLALDLGTTTLAGELLDRHGTIIAAAKTLNPQQQDAPDILARLHSAQNDGARRLQRLLGDGVRRLVARLTELADTECAAIDRAVAAGNPGVSCLLLGLPVASLLRPPHKAPVKGRQQLRPTAVDLGLQVPLDLFPLVTGFIGGDLVAVLYGLETGRAGRYRKNGCGRIPDEPVLVIDIGTNAEIALWDGRRWWATSAAAGPAFEGGNISTGMVHEAGAVTNVHLEGDRLRLTVADGGVPRGLCGSGLVALVSAACEGGLIARDGRIRNPDEVTTNLSRYLVSQNSRFAIRYYRDAVTELLLTQDDLRNLQLAKGAIHAGIRVLLDQAGISAETVTRVFLTGALGTALSHDALKRVALLPGGMLDKTSLEANAVLAGLRAFLGAADGPQRVAELLQKIQPLPLSGIPAFERYYLQSLDFTVSR